MKEYIDDDFSGARSDRPALEELRADVKTDLFNPIYFLNTDRISRRGLPDDHNRGALEARKQIIINGKGGGRQTARPPKPHVMRITTANTRPMYPSQ